jgi:integrative and conjugative element protein (TIGR02256 family)
MRRIWIPAHALTTIEEEANSQLPLETGGVLLGYQTSDASTTVVTGAVGPGPAAVHDVRGFSPDTAYQEREIARIYQESGRMTVYLGDWHTHPAGLVGLSWRDRRTLRRISRYAPARLESPVMVVLAGRQHWKAGGWQYVPGRYVSRAVRVEWVCHGV